MFGKTFKILIAALFLPVVVASTKAFFQGLSGIGIFNFNLVIVASGFLAYPIFHIVFFKPMYIYTIGHEVVHVLATWLSGGKVTSFNVSRSGGSVATTKSNLFISLSPYFVPIHVIVLLLAYWLLSRFYNLSGFAREFTFLVGFTISFHIFMTIEVMKARQSDILKTGYFFSVFFIYTANIFIIFLILSLLFGDVSFLSFAKNAFALSKEIYINIFNALVK